ncbi:hypothetical protein VNO78_11136 [Psophocarpus tetragonolobus]|uniref:Uncharacterized protein n=1 Tax=Psophocarpus tetragonolobus TaxID=3891 RepID=A0AAN9XNC3_PSOTE
MNEQVLGLVDEATNGFLLGRKAMTNRLRVRSIFRPKTDQATYQNTVVTPKWEIHHIIKLKLLPRRKYIL